MARRRPAAQPPPQPARLTAQAMRAGIALLQKRIVQAKQFDPQSVTEQHDIPEIHALSAAIEDALGRTFGADTIEYNRYKNAAFFDNGPYNYAYEVPIHEVHQSL